jgi:hypothetical protein
MWAIIKHYNSLLDCLIMPPDQKPTKRKTALSKKLDEIIPERTTAGQIKQGFNSLANAASNFVGYKGSQEPNEPQIEINHNALLDQIEIPEQNDDEADLSSIADIEEHGLNFIELARLSSLPYAQRSAYIQQNSIVFKEKILNINNLIDIKTALSDANGKLDTASMAELFRLCEDKLLPELKNLEDLYQLHALTGEEFLGANFDAKVSELSATIDTFEKLQHFLKNTSKQAQKIAALNIDNIEAVIPDISRLNKVIEALPLETRMSFFKENSKHFKELISHDTISGLVIELKCATTEEKKSAIYSQHKQALYYAMNTSNHETDFQQLNELLGHTSVQDRENLAQIILTGIIVKTGRDNPDKIDWPNAYKILQHANSKYQTEFIKTIATNDIVTINSADLANIVADPKIETAAKIPLVKCYHGCIKSIGDFQALSEHLSVKDMMELNQELKGKFFFSSTIMIYAKYFAMEYLGCLGVGKDMTLKDKLTHYLYCGDPLGAASLINKASASDKENPTFAEDKSYVYDLAAAKIPAAKEPKGENKHSNSPQDSVRLARQALQALDQKKSHARTEQTSIRPK